MPEISAEAMEEARRYVRRKRIFYTVLGVWIVLCVMWFLIDVRDDSSSWWFYWPVLGTGIAVVITGIVLLGLGGLFGADWERREIDNYLRRRGNDERKGGTPDERLHAIAGRWKTSGHVIGDPRIPSTASTPTKCLRAVLRRASRRRERRRAAGASDRSHR